MTLKRNRQIDLASRKTWKNAKLSKQDIKVSKIALGYGLIQYTAFGIWDAPFVMGTVILKVGSGYVGSAEILDSYVIPYCRRHGVRTAIQDAIVKDYKQVTSTHGTKEGEAWMRSYGYRYDRRLGRWEYNR
jgi:hypothetical protein